MIVLGNKASMIPMSSVKMLSTLPKSVVHYTCVLYRSFDKLLNTTFFLYIITMNIIKKKSIYYPKNLY